jgi:hypothetical protein
VLLYIAQILNFKLGITKLLFFVFSQLKKIYGKSQAKQTSKELHSGPKRVKNYIDCKVKMFYIIKHYKVSKLLFSKLLKTFFSGVFLKINEKII